MPAPFPASRSTRAPSPCPVARTNSSPSVSTSSPTGCPNITRRARFAKWRAVIDIGAGIPTHACLHANAHALARYAALCQAAQIVPIVEPEVLMDGDHDIDRCYGVTEWVLKETFQELYYNRVALEGIVLKPNMAVPGNKSAKRAGVEEVAEMTVRLLKNCVPGAVPGIAFLSGGQSDEEATAHLDAMNRIGGVVG